MGTTADYVKEFVELGEKIKELESLIPREIGFKATAILENYKGLFDRFCPHQIGDRVRLTQAPEIGPNSRPGWQGCEHFLVVDAVGVVRSRDFRDGKFVFAVEFENEHYLYEGRVIPPSSKHTFSFSEKYLAPHQERGDRDATT